MSLLQDVLRFHTDVYEKDDSDDELVNVVCHLINHHDSRSALLIFVCHVSLPGTPARSRPSSRAPSPTGRGASGRPLPKPLHLRASPTKDPLKVLPTEISQRIFGYLSISNLAKCARVSRKWNKSQTIN